MIRKLILFALLLGLAQSAYAQARVRDCPVSATLNGGNNSGTTVTCTFASNSANDLLVIFGMVDDRTKTLTLADGAANTWNTVVSNLADPAAVVVTSVWYTCKSNVSAGSNIVTMTVNTTSSNLWVGGAEYSGLDSSSGTACLDQTNNNFRTSATAWSSPSVTPTVGNEVYTGFAAGGDGSATLSAGTNIAWVMQQKTVNGNRSPGWEDFIASSAAAVTANFTYSTAQGGHCIIATFKTAAAAGGGSVKKKKVIFY